MPSRPKPHFDLSRREATRIALGAAGLAVPRPKRAGPAALAAMFDRLGMVQIDSVSVLARAHYMPGFSRLGAYQTALLDAAAFGRRRSLFEYWGHEASYIRIDLQPALRWRMEEARRGERIYKGLVRFAQEKAAFIDAVLREIETRGALAARDLGEGGKGQGGWWGWSDGKLALEWLFWTGFVTTKERRGFERVYDLPERVLGEVATRPTPPADEAQRLLLRLAARALGVATVTDLRAYWRIGPKDAAARVAELVEEGALRPVAVEGWTAEGYVPAEMAPLRRPAAAALVSPFDPLLWERDRAERLFGFRYRIEIYTPAHKREHGYYVLPFLMGSRIVARLDLKADRAADRLVIHAAHGEPGIDREAVAAALAAELRLLAEWIGVSSIVLSAKGDLESPLRAALCV